MGRFADSMKQTVSVLALLGTNLAVATAARADIIAGTQTSFSQTTLATGSTLEFANTAVVSPGGARFDNGTGGPVNILVNTGAIVSNIGEITRSDFTDASDTLTGFFIEDLEGDFTNNGTISAELLISAEEFDAIFNGADATVTGERPNLTGAAYGVRNDTDFTGTFTNTSSDSILAEAVIEADYALSAQGSTNADVDFDLDVDASGNAVWIEGFGNYSVVNTGTLEGIATANTTVVGLATSSDGDAKVELDEIDLRAQAYGFYEKDNAIPSDFDNSGDILATALNTGSLSALADGATGAFATVDLSIDATAEAVAIDRIVGDFNNDGTIAAKATIDLPVTVSAESSEENANAKLVDDNDVFSDIDAQARGVEIEALDAADDEDFATFVNSSVETISAEASIDGVYDISAMGQTDATVTYSGIDFIASATGVVIEDGDYTFENTGAIAAIGRIGTPASEVEAEGETEGGEQEEEQTVAAEPLQIVLSATAPGEGADANINVNGDTVYFDATAYAVDLYGTVYDFNNSGTIDADADLLVAIEAVAEAANDAEVAFTTLEPQAEATAVYVQNLDGDFDNSGSINAAATLDFTVQADAIGGDGDSTAELDIDKDRLEAQAHGVWISSIGEFDDEEVEDGASFINSSVNTISATAEVDTLYDLSASVEGSGKASVSVTRVEVSLHAEGVFIDDGVYDVANSGTIRSEARLGSAQIDAVEDENGDIVTPEVAEVRAQFISSAVSPEGDADADAGLVDADVRATGFLGEGTATGFSNEEAGAITADAELLITVSAVATAGDEANATVENELRAVATAVYLEDLTGAFSNSGSLEASAELDADVLASASAGVSSADNYVDNQVTVQAIGADLDGVSTSFANSGSIAAQATAAISETYSANGETSGYIDISNEVDVSATGVELLDTLAGDFNNTGSITADASLNASLDVNSQQSEGPDFVDISYDNEVSAIGVAAEFLVGATEEGDPIMRSFTNGEGGVIAATGSLISNKTIVAGAQDEPTETDVAPSDTPLFSTDMSLMVVGAQLTGGLGTVTNDGSISAEATIDAEDGTARAIGLWLPDAQDGLVINNAGDISASVGPAAAPADDEGGEAEQGEETTGDVAADADAIAVLVGPLEAPEPVVEPEPTEPDTGEEPEDGGEAEVPGLITVNNSGTISATNTTGVGRAIGIMLENAPEPVTINQSGGSIDASTAIAMDQGTNDILNWTGGTIAGLVDADAGDVVNVFGGGTVEAGTEFALDGAGAVNVNLTDSTEATTFFFGGTIENTGSLNINPYGNLHLDTTADINLVGNTLNIDEMGTLTIDLQPGGPNGTIEATGDANIDGTLAVNLLPGTYSDSEVFRIITADVDETNTEEAMDDTVNGTFDAVTGGSILLDVAAEIGDTTVDITLNRVGFDEVAEISGDDTNVLAVGGGLEAGYDPDTLEPGDNDPDLHDVITNLFTLTDGSAYRDMLFSWAGSEHAQLGSAAVNLAEPYFMSVSEHLNDTRLAGRQEVPVVSIRSGLGTALSDPQASAGQSGGNKKASFWGRAFGRWTSNNGDINASGFDEEIFGIVIGLDYLVTDNVRIGIAAAYTDDSIDFDNGADGDIERFTIGGYVSAALDNYYLDASFSYADDDYELSRWGIYGGAACPTYDCVMSGIDSSYGGDAFLLHGEAGYIYRMGNSPDGTVIQPFLGLNHSNVDVNGFTETGFGDLSLDVADGGGKSTQLRLGTRISANWNTDGSTVIRPELRLEWRHEFENDPYSFDANLVGDSGIAFTTIGSAVADDLFVIGAGVTATFGGGINAFFEYQGALGSGYNAHIIQAGARIPF